MQEPARIAIDLGAQSCRVSLLRWLAGKPSIQVVHRISNGPVRVDGSLHWELGRILAGLEDGLRKAAELAPEGVASIAVDCWGVDYVRLTPDGKPLRDPFCYRDERTVATKEAADKIVSPFDFYQITGAMPVPLNTAYQLMADPAAGIDPATPWATIPEYITIWLGGRRVSEFTLATHTGLVDQKAHNWSAEAFRLLGLSLEAAPEIVLAGTVVGKVQGPLAALPAFHNTQLIVPACHDTASAIAGIPADLSSTAYISSGTWSLVGTLTNTPVTTRKAFDAGYTNLGAATGDLLFHSMINSMWVLQQCMEGWQAQGRGWKIEDIVRAATEVSISTGIVDMDAPPLMLDSDMPNRINAELAHRGFDTVADVAGNEPIFARIIFESLSVRYAAALAALEQMLGRKLTAIHMLGGANRNKLLVHLTEERTGLPVQIGQTESTTVGNLAVQMASSEAGGQPPSGEAVRKWAAILCQE
jgi:rhamnulokinase